jgi:hypothetical protein
MVTIRDAWNKDLYGAVEMTDVINRSQKAISDLSKSLGAEEVRVATDAIALEVINDTVQVIQSSPRGGPGVRLDKTKRSGIRIETVRYDQEDTITADEIRNVWATGGNFLKNIASERNDRVARMGVNLDQTQEYVLQGMTRGTILDADGSIKYDLCDLLNLTKPDELVLDSSGAEPLKAFFQKMRRQMAAALGVQAQNGFGIEFEVGDDLYDHIVNLDETQKAYERFQDGAFLREGGLAFERFAYGGVMIINKLGSDDGLIGTPAEKGFARPVGVPGLYKLYFSPSDKIDDIGGRGLPRYSWGYPDLRGRQIDLEAQMNVLGIMSKPQALLEVDLV